MDKKIYSFDNKWKKETKWFRCVLIICAIAVIIIGIIGFIIFIRALYVLG